MWKERIQGFGQTYRFTEPAEGRSILQAEGRLSVRLPDSLRTLLQETDGLFDQWNCPLIWQISKILERNIELREDSIYWESYMPLESLLFFADAGTGDLFGHPVINGSIPLDSVFTWSPITDNRILVAPSLDSFIREWGSGRLTI